MADPSRLRRILAARWADKSIALVAVTPFAYFLWTMVRLGDFDLPRSVLLVQLAAIVVTMAVRRPPVRVTTNPLFWVLAFIATYWPYSVGGFDWYQTGAPLVPAWLSNGLSLASLAVALWARFSLGRNIGIVPAERTLVTTGAYAYVRHPIYSGIFVGVLTTALSEFSWRNVALDAVWCGLWVVKTFIEERFLRENPAYLRYMGKVRWRWCPGVA